MKERMKTSSLMSKIYVVALALTSSSEMFLYLSLSSTLRKMKLETMASIGFFAAR